MAIQITKQEQTTQVTLTIPSAEADAIGAELHLLADELDTVLWALALLRTGHTHRDKSAPEGRPATLGGSAPANVGSQRLLEIASRQDVHDRALWTPTAAATGAAGASTALVGTPETVAAAILDYVAAKEGLSLPDVENLLNKQSGLLGISGLTNDMRELLAEEAENGDRRARLLDLTRFAERNIQLRRRQQERGDNQASEHSWRR